MSGEDAGAPAYPSAAAAEVPAIELIGIDKRFGVVHANKSIDLVVAKGSIHGIVGENGAGKSTLMSILFGFYEADSGWIKIHGRPRRIRASREAIAAGIGMVHQHFMLAEPLTALENIMMGAEGGFTLAAPARAMRAKLAALARDYGLDVDPDARVGDLPVGLQQRVEILKILVRGADILILDEPTAVLTPAEADNLFAMLRGLRDAGKTVLFITHKLREIMDLTDRVSVMRAGAMVAHFDTKATSPPALAEAMVGRKVQLKAEKSPSRPGPALLEARNLTMIDARGVKALDNVSLTLRAGEIVGVAGVSGNGQSALLDALAGIVPFEGEILIEGKLMAPAALNPRALRRIGLAHVPEDRQKRGLIMPFEAQESAILGYHDSPVYGAGAFLDPRSCVADLAAKMETWDVRPRAPRLKTANFSGGNQQKIVIAREVEHGGRILLIGQPTRGVDIGAIEFIHKRLIGLRDQRKALLLVSVELDEILALSDRILVMCAGRITGERDGASATARELGLLMAGITETAA